MTIEEVHEVTRIAASQIQSFETGTLYDQDSMNPVYLRAFVREYAKAVGVPPDAAAESLEAALDGTYENQLAVEYLEAPPEVVDRTDSTSSAGSSGEEEPPAKESHTRSPQTPAQGGAEGTAPSDSPGPVEGEEGASASAQDSSPPSWIGGDGGNEGGGAPEKGASSQTSPSDSSPSDWDSSSVASERSSESRTSSGEAFGSGYNTEVLLTGVGVFLLVALLVGFGISFLTGTGGFVKESVSSETTSGKDQVSMSPSSDTSSSSSLPPQASLTLGDTLHVTVLATSKVQEMRVQQDEDLRRPYWIEQGNALVFPFTNRITIENQLDSVRLFVERYPYPTSRTDSLGRIVLERQTVEAFADTLRGSPPTLSVQPDTVGLRTLSGDSE